MLIYGLFLILSIWLISLTIVLWRTRRHYFKLTKHTQRHRLDEILEKLLDNETINHKKINELSVQINKTIEKAAYHFQKIGIARYNPFGRTEGEKSFILALLDGDNNGVVINFIYTHEGIRVYPKKVKKAQGLEYELSEEEKKAVEKAN